MEQNKVCAFSARSTEYIHMYPVRGGNVLLPYSVQGLLERTRVLGTLEVRSSVHMPTASQPLSHDNGYVVQKARLGSTPLVSPQT